jgi:diguanylate cyclase (GGDEF)-like protein/PAS domain S-box-containing protein
MGKQSPPSPPSETSPDDCALPYRRKLPDNRQYPEGTRRDQRRGLMSRSVLLVADKLSDRSAVVGALIDTHSVSFLLEQVGLLSEGLERLSQDSAKSIGAPDRVAAIILDLFLPDSTGIETFDQLFQATPHIPILVLASSADEPIAKLAVQHGAQDYLLKPRLDGYSLCKALQSMVERTTNAEALFAHRELAEITLNAIGEAVISVNVVGEVTYLNAVAEHITGWPVDEAVTRPLEEVLHIVNGVTRASVPSPLMLAIDENKLFRLSPDCVLIRRDGSEAGIEDAATPIHDRSGQVTGAVMVFRDVTEARASALRTSHLAQHDALSGLANRALVNDRLAHAITAAERHNAKLAVLFIDVDRFKQINDSVGHAVGDRLLQAVAQRLLACVRHSDTVGRLGGDEFIVILSEVSHSDDAAISADKLLVALSRPYNIDTHDIHITASIGIATYPDDALDGETLLKHADVAMYHAKDGGRNQHQFFEKNRNRLAGERLALEAGLRRALAQNEFLLHYQPKVDLRTGAITGVESLIRWRHPEHGIVPAAPFIHVAEQCGLIVPIGRWVLGEACRQSRAWLDAGLPATPIAVNASALELTKKGFVDHVRATLSTFNLEPKSLELELTETYLAQEPNLIGEALRELKSLGVQLAFDDFGTGFASLSGLKKLPIDALKIDQSFVRDLPSDDDDASIVIAMITLGRSLHLRVVAEGVQTRRQLTFLKEHNCPEGQGYFFSRPLPAEDFSLLLGRRFTVRPTLAATALAR